MNKWNERVRLACVLYCLQRHGFFAADTLQLAIVKEVARDLLGASWSQRHLLLLLEHAFLVPEPKF